MFAVAYGKLDIMNILLDAKADVNLVTTDGATALMVACQASDVSIETSKIMVKKLIQAGINVNAQMAGPRGLLSSIGSTALIDAAEVGDTEIIQMLIDAGADVHAKTRRNKTALDFAQKSKKKDAIELLQHYIN